MTFDFVLVPPIALRHGMASSWNQPTQIQLSNALSLENSHKGQLKDANVTFGFGVITFQLPYQKMNVFGGT